MKVSEMFYNIKCDCCGELIDSESWWQYQKVNMTFYSIANNG